MRSASERDADARFLNKAAGQTPVLFAIAFNNTSCSFIIRSNS
jgi:hypothetical protein